MSTKACEAPLMPTDLRDHQREAVRVLCWSSGDYLNPAKSSGALSLMLGGEAAMSTWITEAA